MNLGKPHLAARRWAHPALAGGVWRFDEFGDFFERMFVQFAILIFSRFVLYYNCPKGKGSGTTQVAKGLDSKLSVVRPVKYKKISD